MMKIPKKFGQKIGFKPKRYLSEPPIIICQLTHMWANADVLQILFDYAIRNFTEILG